jgi:hypothetical protein
VTTHCTTNIVLKKAATHSHDAQCACKPAHRSTKQILCRLPLRRCSTRPRCTGRGPFYTNVAPTQMPLPVGAAKAVVVCLQFAERAGISGMHLGPVSPHSPGVYRLDLDGCGCM